LYETQPVFRDALEKCDACCEKCWNGEIAARDFVSGRILKTGQRARSSTQYTQPALFALEYALAEVWASWGVKPDIVLGHSVASMRQHAWPAL